MTAKTPDEILAALSAPFPAESIGFKAQVVKGNRALAVPYIDARDVAERLDEALGPDGWETELTPLPEGNFLCRLTVHFPGGRSVVRTDLGGESDQPDAGDKAKAAVSDSLKRAAVQLGIGRYIYRLPKFWTDYNPTTKEVTPPRLPDWALPRKSPAPQAAQPAAARTTEPPPADPETAAEREAIEAEARPVSGAPDPATDHAAYTALAKASQTKWVDAVAWMNAHLRDCSYPPGTKFPGVSVGHRRALVAELRQKLPDVPAEG